MVKNTKGGKGAKNLARKTQSGDSGSGKLRLPTCELEQYACVTKMLGNGMCEIYTNENVKLLGHIRSKFRGRQKRNNIISLFSIVMIGLREWENPIKNCDILCVFDEVQIDQLKDLPQIDIRHILQLRLINEASKSEYDVTNENVLFTNDIDEEKENISQRLEKFEMDAEDEIDIDDI